MQISDTPPPLKKKFKFTKPVKRTLYTQLIRFECDSIIVRQYPTAKFMAIVLLLLLSDFEPQQSSWYRMTVFYCTGFLSMRRII